jgi:hypothetical protein
MILELSVASIADSEQRFLILLAQLPLIGGALGTHAFAAFTTMVTPVASGELHYADLAVVQLVECH